MPLRKFLRQRATADTATADTANTKLSRDVLGPRASHVSKETEKSVHSKMVTLPGDKSKQKDMRKVSKATEKSVHSKMVTLPGDKSKQKDMRKRSALEDVVNVNSRPESRPSGPLAKDQRPVVQSVAVPGAARAAVKASKSVKVIPVNVVRPQSTALVRGQKRPAEGRCKQTKQVKQSCVDLLDLDKLRNELPDARRLPPGVEDVDKGETDYFYSPDFALDIMDYLLLREKEFKITLERYDKDSKVTTKMRSILVDWLLQVQTHLGLFPETLHKIVGLIDLFLDRVDLDLRRIQLVGITCVLIASKFEERFPPSIAKLIHLTENSYTFDEVVTMERVICRKLNFAVSVPTPVIFLERYYRVTGSSEKVELMSRYFLDLGLTDPDLCCQPPSLRAAAALYLANHLEAHEKGAASDGVWTPTLEAYSSYSKTDLQPCVALYRSLVKKAKTSKFQGARDKYSSRSAFQAVSQWPLLHSTKVMKVLELEDANTGQTTL